MARAMNAAGATGEEIARTTMAALEESGVDKKDAAQLAMEAVAASGAKPGDIAKSMHKLIGDSGKLLCNTYNLIIRSINTDLNTCSTVP